LSDNLLANPTVSRASLLLHHLGTHRQYQCLH
jgi:hypothetical protein